MKFGYFDDARREYVITTPETPYPWINYLGSQAFFSLISNTAGGYSFYRDAKLRNIFAVPRTNLVSLHAAGSFKSRKKLSGRPGLRRTRYEIFAFSSSFCFSS